MSNESFQKEFQLLEEKSKNDYSSLSTAISKKALPQISLFHFAGLTTLLGSRCAESFAVRLSDTIIYKRIRGKLDAASMARDCLDESESINLRIVSLTHQTFASDLLDNNYNSSAKHSETGSFRDTSNRMLRDRCDNLYQIIIANQIE